MYATTREEFLATSITPANPSPSDTECAICKQDYNITTHTAVTFSDSASCKHVFCETCIVAWLNAKGTNSCPLCRRELFVLAYGDKEVDYDMNIDFDTDSDGDIEYYFGGEGEEGGGDDGDENEDENEDIPLTYLYRDELRLQMTPAEINDLLLTIWHKIWNLLSTYRSKLSQAVQAVQEGKGLPIWYIPVDSYLPTTQTMVTSFVNTVSANTGTDISGTLTAEKLGRLETLLQIILEEQVKRVHEADGWPTEDILPGFEGEWKEDWSNRVCLLLGLASPRSTSEQ